MNKNERAVFDDLPWHDSTILRIEIDRTEPGNRDEILAQVVWPDGTEEVVRFFDCYAAEALLNFGVMAPESVLEGSATTEGPEITALRRKWGSLGVDLSDIKRFELLMSSTGSRIRVYALGFEISRAE